MKPETKAIISTIITAIFFTICYIYRELGIFVAKIILHFVQLCLGSFVILCFYLLFLSFFSDQSLVNKTEDQEC